MKHRPLPHLQRALDERRAARLLREPPPRFSPERTFCSNDYLGLAREALGSGLDTRPEAPVGAGASRLVCGDHDAHARLESALASWLGLPSALVFASGYAANVGTLSALLERGDVVLSDTQNHASLIDGMRLGRAEIVRFAHNDLGDLREKLSHTKPAGRGRTWIVTESYFSMEGDGPDLARLRAIADAAGALLVLDEAHAIGVFGPEGRGLSAEAGITPDVLLGTLGKALGGQGAFAAGALELTRYLWNTARSFVFSTGISPALADRLCERVAVVRDADRRRAELHENTRVLREGLASLGCILHGHGPILSWVLGDEGAALERASAIQARGFHVQAIRPPTVPRGTSRLRITTTASHRAEDVASFLRAMREVVVAP